MLQGRIVEVREDSEEARVVYDDEMEEWLALASERFRWLAPRAASAGGTRALQVRAPRMLCIPGPPGSPGPIDQHRRALRSNALSGAHVFWVGEPPTRMCASKAQVAHLNGCPSTRRGC